MSEHTLDDLAARLSALEGWSASRLLPPNELDAVHAICRVDDDIDANMLIDAVGRIVEVGETYFIPIVWTGLDAIRQWQASAEPAAPPAAPVVTITEDELIEVINAAHANDDESGCDGDYTDTRQRTLQAINDAIKIIQIVCPEYPALRGADLAPEPEGARDGK